MTAKKKLCRLQSCQLLHPFQLYIWVVRYCTFNPPWAGFVSQPGGYPGQPLWSCLGQRVLQQDVSPSSSTGWSPWSHSTEDIGLSWGWFASLLGHWASGSQSPWVISLGDVGQWILQSPLQICDKRIPEGSAALPLWVGLPVFKMVNRGCYWLSWGRRHIE